MNKLKKLGLTALAGSLVATTSAMAGSLSATGSASVGLTNVTQSQGTTDTLTGVTGNGWSMGNSVTFAGSGDLDNGMTVSVSLEMDDHGSDAIDDKSIKIDTGNGVIGFATSVGGIGGIGTIANKVPNASQIIT